jgi:carboxyl-terminal processing protease
MDAKHSSRRADSRLLLSFAAACALSGCTSAASSWRPLPDAGTRDRPIEGVWEDPATGHIVDFTAGEGQVFHVLGDFCIQDTGVVPGYSLYRFGKSNTELLLHHYDYRNTPELLQAPQVFRRVSALPEACSRPAVEERLPPARLFALIASAFDRFYEFFAERGVDWEAVTRDNAARAEALANDGEVFDLLSEMLSPLGDGHVNVTWADRSFNAGSPRLRARLGDAWAKSGSTLSEQAFVSEWHRGVVESVNGVLDAGSLRSGASNALEWGTIGGSVGYLRVNRFTGFAETSTPRPTQYKVLAAALDQMRNDLASATTLVVDVALNGGGSDAAALLVASYFADTRRPVLRYEADGAPAQEIMVPSRGEGETRPIVLLTSEITASAAESFVLMMRAFPHVTHTGGRTRGGLSSLLPKPFPNGFMVTLAYQRVLDAEGTSFEGVGIPPEVAVELFPDENLREGFALALRRIAAAGRAALRAES